jgi:hypothetical protein
MKKDLRILVKFPTRSRPEQFLKTLTEYYNKAKDNSNIDYLISYDLDDSKMTPLVIARAQSLGKNIKLVGGYSKSKIDACNRDIKKPYKWDIILLVSDDMFIQVDEWDEVIRYSMLKYYPDTDGCLWFNDGHQNRICTLSCVGKKYYERFNYLYHPSYKSLWCDNEFTDVAKSLNKMTYMPMSLVNHQHPCWGRKVPNDDLYKLNEGFFNEDANNYKKRKAVNFAD